MNMKVYIRSRPRQGCYSVRFYTGIVRPTGELDVDGIQDLMAEVQRMHDLLKELSAREYVPTREDLMDFHTFLLERQQLCHDNPLKME